MNPFRISAFALAAVSLFAQGQQQQPGAGAGGPAPSPGTGTAPGIGTPGTGTPGQGRNTSPFPDQTQQQQFPQIQRPIFLSGKVVTDDGTPPPEPATIERICGGGNARPEGYTDSKGRFSFELGRNMGMMQDASVSSSNDTFGNRGGGMGQGGIGGMGAGGMGGTSGISERDLMGCEIRANLPGYVSSVVNLSGRRMLDNPDVGTIILKRLAGVEGMTFSMTSAMAPKDAKKSYEKAREQIKKKKIDEAQKELEKAVEVYPKYAVAWYELGMIYQQASRKDEARKAYEASLKADDKYVNPYLQLAVLSAGENNWKEVDETTDRVIQLNPINFPQAYFFNSVANYNLQNFDEAEKSAREAVKLDGQHRWPKAQHLLGILLAGKGENQAAVENMRGYLKFNPNGNDKSAVEKQIAEIEERLKGGTAQAQPNNP
ncbi:MAG: tetratricopeptide repeat protein [Acidobacteriota bacterium]